MPIVGPLWRGLRKWYRRWKGRLVREAVERRERSLRGEQVVAQLDRLVGRMGRLSQALQDGKGAVVGYIADDVVAGTEGFEHGLEDAIGTTALSELMAVRHGAVVLRKRVRTLGEPVDWDLSDVWAQHDTVEKAADKARNAVKQFMQRRGSA